MPLSPEDFYRHALAAADEEQRLPLARMTGWDVSPFEPEGLRVSPTHWSRRTAVGVAERCAAMPARALGAGLLVLLMSACSADADPEPVGQAVLDQVDAPGQAWDVLSEDEVFRLVDNGAAGEGYAATAGAGTTADICGEAAAWMAATAAAFPGDVRIDSSESETAASCRSAARRAGNGETSIVGSFGADADEVHYLAFLTVTDTGPEGATVTVSAAAEDMSNG